MSQKVYQSLRIGQILWNDPGDMNGHFKY